MSIVTNLKLQYIQKSIVEMQSSQQELLRRKSKNQRIISSYSIQSSFTLNNSQVQQEYDQQNIGKILNRLGLQDHKQRGAEALFEDAANIFLKKQMNADFEEQKELEYAITYAEAAKQKQQHQNKYIYVSQFTDMEYLEAINEKRMLLKLYKYLRVGIKWISLVCQSIVETSLFQSLVLLVIVLNSIKMALQDPLKTQTSPTILLIQELFLIFYVTEMSIKILALGFLFNKGSYLRDAWNILDFFIVVTSLLPYVISMSFNVSALRAIRVLRPLKTITKVKALKMIVKTLFLSFSLVMNSFIILLFVIIIFSIAGTQLFSGQLKFKCMQLISGITYETVCNNHGQCEGMFGLGYVCAKTQGSPHFSIYNFDTIFWSMASTFQTITLQSWSSIMLHLEEGYSFLSFIFSIGIIISCQYITLNMTMAILKYKYSEVKTNKIQEEEEEIDEYAPELLKKIGTFKNVTEIHDVPYFRYKTDDRYFVGSTHFFTEQMSYKRRKRLQNRLAKKMPKRKSRRDTKIVEIHPDDQNSRKWDPKTLHFEPISFDQIELDQKGFITKRSPQMNQISEESDEDEIIVEEEKPPMSEMNMFPESRGDISVVSSIREGMKQNSEESSHSDEKSENSDSKIQQIPTEKLITVYNVPPKKAKLNDIFQFNKLLTQIQNPSKKPEQDDSDEQLLLPDIKMDEDKVENFYNQFSKLGAIGIKKRPKALMAKLLARMSRRSSAGKQAQKNVIAKVVEEGQLDIKELQLANELSTKKLKCRIKRWKNLNEQTNYPVEQILVSMKRKIQEQAKKQIQQKTKQIKAKILYLQPEKKIKPQLLEDHQFSSLNNYNRRKKNPQDMSGDIDIPVRKAVHKTMKLIESKFETSQVRLLSDEPLQKFNNQRLYKRNGILNQTKQNIVLAAQIQMKQQDVLKHYFDSQKNNQKIMGNANKKRNLKKKKDDNPEQINQSNEQIYYQTKNDDIFKRQGQIEMRCSGEDVIELETHEFALVSALNLTDKDYDIYIPTLKGVFKSIHAKLLTFVEASLYDTVILLIVVFNTVMMCMSGLVDIYGEPWDTIDYAFTTIFLIDVGLKIIAYGQQFFEDTMNILDFVVSVISMVDANLPTTNLSALKSLRVLRTLRVVRVARLIRSLSYMKIILAVITTVLTEFMYIFLLLILFIFIYTLLGMETLGGTFVSPAVSQIRQNFDSFQNALFAVFQVLTVENWDDIESVIILSSNSNFTILYLISWIVLGNWILLNLTQAILLDGFDDDSVTQELEPPVPQAEQSKPEQNNKQVEDQEKFLKQSEGEEQRPQNLEYFEDQYSKPSQNIKTKKPQNYSLFLFSSQNPVRKFIMKVIDHWLFENIYLFLIVLSCGKLVFDTYIKSTDTLLISISDKIDLFFNIVFLIEATVKIIGLGFFIGQNTYLQSSWEKLDFIIVVTIVIDLCTPKTVNLKIIKLLRALRPLKIISRNLNMKIIISALGDSMTGMLNILIIILTVFCMFAILGMNLLAGKLNYCNYPSPNLTYGQFGPYGVGKDQCQLTGGVWTTQFVNFQNIFNSLLSLYIFSTRQNWPYYIYTFIDAETQGPIYNNNYILFFIFAVVFIFTCSYFLMDLMIGILFMNFHAAQNKLRPKLLQDCQINWINLQKIIIENDPCLALYLQPENKLQKFFFKIANHRYFDPIVIVIILLNIFTMMVQMDDSAHLLTTVLTYMNLGYSCIFITEMIIKLLAYDKNYFLIGWNIFDFCVVMASILDIILTYAQGVTSTPALSVLPQIARIFRVLRVTKLLRLFKQFKGLQKLIQTFIYMMPAFANGLALLLLYLFIMSIISCFLMSDIISDSSGFFSGQNNFNNFHSALQTLYITMTGQNWYIYMFESTTPGYVDCLNPGCTQPVNFLFWLVFIFCGQKIFLQMLGLIVLDQFDYNYIRQNNPLGVFALLESDFRDNWILATKKHKAEKMQSKQLVDFVLKLRQPLGMSLDELQEKYQSELKQNDQLTEQDVKAKVYQFYMKLKHSAARHVFKINSLLSQNLLTYHQTFYYLSKAAYYNQFIEQSTPFQLQLVDQQNKKSEDHLLSKQTLQQRELNKNFEMNPMQKILFFQMCINAWERYATTKLQKKQQKNLQQDESYIQSYMSIPEQIKIQQQQASNMKRKAGVINNRSFAEYTVNSGVPNTDMYQRSIWTIANKRNSRQASNIRPSLDLIKKKSRRSSLTIKSKDSKKSSTSRIQ